MTNDTKQGVLKQIIQKVGGTLWDFFQKEEAIKEESQKIVADAVKKSDQKMIDDIKNKIDNLKI